ncbi:MAG: heavy metal translocating P-type ATPase [Propylenella sp.]
MSCCGAAAVPTVEPLAASSTSRPPVSRVDSAFVSDAADGLKELSLIVPGMHCAGCLRTVETTLLALPGVGRARANLTAKKAVVGFDPAKAAPEEIAVALEKAGYAARPVDPAVLNAASADQTGSELLRALAVAGFAAGNIMLLSVSVWAGAEADTRNLFHWLSALIALPAVAYAGRPFFHSAARALAARRLNMDVPISLGVLLSAGMSLYETAIDAEHAWFDASVALLFFLLTGRYLDHRMRAVARSAATRLLSLSADTARVVGGDGTARLTRTSDVSVGAVIEIAAGERVPLDGAVLSGRSDIDKSMLTGEPLPEAVAERDHVFAGTLNLTGPLTVRVEKASRDTLLADIAQLMEEAESGRGHYVGLADRATRLYSPAVHILAATTLLGWLVAGAGFHDSLMIAVAVLIITCPCALGLAVPAVQVVASGALLKRGILLKDGGALERLADIDAVVFDKTGTLTTGEPVLAEEPAADQKTWSLAAALAERSRHPLARALAEAARARGIVPASAHDIVEHPGLGMAGRLGVQLRLGRQSWAAGEGRSAAGAHSEIWFRAGRHAPVAFRFLDRLRPEAASVVEALRDPRLSVALRSGDRADAVAAAAAAAGIGDWRGGCRAVEKAAELARRREAGERVLMVGDGINDAPALAAASVSMAPASGSDISQVAADLVFTTSDLRAVPAAIGVARRAKRIVLENFGIAILYNCVAVPLAMAGLVTPLIAAIAMSSSSILVTANALRLAVATRPARPAQMPRLPAMRRAAA